MKSSRLLPYIMGAVIISASTQFLILPKPALAGCNSFGTCTRTERRVHCKSFGRCAAQHRICTATMANPRTGTKASDVCGEWKNSL
jgi:hypothetical protein